MNWDASFHISFSICLLGSVSSLMAVKGVDSHMTRAQSWFMEGFFFKKKKCMDFSSKKKNSSWIDSMNGGGLVDIDKGAHQGQTCTYS